MAKPAGTALDQDSWEEVSDGNLIKWDAPKTVIGTVVAVTTQAGQYGEQKKFTIHLDGGEPASFFAPSVLARLLEPIQVGQRIKIEYPGTTTKSKSGRPVKDFKLYVAKA